MTLQRRETNTAKPHSPHRSKKPKAATPACGRWWAAMLLATLLTACHYPTPEPGDRWQSPSAESIDSVSFRSTHHYWLNFNFCVVADSLTLHSRRPGDDSWTTLRDSVRVGTDDRLVVADIRKVPTDSTDSIWVKVARDQFTQGWVREKHLLRSAIPDAPISRLIHHMSRPTTRLMQAGLSLLVLLLLVRTARCRRLPMVHINDIPSFYPTLLCLLVSGCAALSSSVQRCVSETWAEFCYHPTLNPLELPPIMALLITGVWLIIIVGGAVIDDVRHSLTAGSTLAYLATLAGVCTVLHLVFSLTGHTCVGLPLLLAYWLFALHTHRRHHAARYLCGHCATPLKQKGPCPRCGKLNR